MACRQIVTFGRIRLYTCEQHLHRCQQLKRNNLVPRNSFHHSSSFAQGMCEQYELHFSLLYNQPPVQPNISVELISAHAHGLVGDDLLKYCYLFDEQDRERPLKMFPKLPKEYFSTTLWYPNHMVLAFPP